MLLVILERLATLNGTRAMTERRIDRQDRKGQTARVCGAAGNGVSIAAPAAFGQSAPRIAEGGGRPGGAGTEVAVAAAVADSGGGGVKRKI